MTSDGKNTLWERFWTSLSRLSLLYQVGLFVSSIVSASVTGLCAYIEGSPPSHIILVSLSAMLVVGWTYVRFIDWKMKAMQADTDARLTVIRSRVRVFCANTPTSKAEAQDIARSLISYVSSALSVDHATSLRHAAMPILETGGGTSAWKRAFSDVKGLALGLADSITADDIQPFAVQALGWDNTDLFRPVDLSHTAPGWRSSNEDFPIVPYEVDATGSGASQALRFSGEDTAYGMDFECRPHISKRCHVRIVYRPTEGKEYMIYIRMAGRKPNGQASNNQWFAVAYDIMLDRNGMTHTLSRSDSGHSAHHDYDHEWFLELEHKPMSLGWVEVKVDVWPEHQKTLATIGFRLVAIAGLRVRGYVDIAAIEFLPVDKK